MGVFVLTDAKLRRRNYKKNSDFISGGDIAVGGALTARSRIITAFGNC